MQDMHDHRPTALPSGVYGGAPKRAPLTDRINVEPAILHGMNVTEARVIALASSVAFLVAASVVFILTGWWQAVLLITLIGPLVTLWLSSKALARIKRGRPDGFYTQALNLWLSERGLARSRFLTYGGWWSLGRTLDFSLASPVHPAPGHDGGADPAHRAAKRTRSVP